MSTYMMPSYDFLIVGAGFAGSVCARVLADAGKTVLLIDTRDHIGGNAYDRFDEHGILIHPYGPHIFHTNSVRIIEFLSRFTDWRFYEHRVLAEVGGKLYPIPINLTTINRLYKLSLNEEEVKDFLERVREPRSPIVSSEDIVLSHVGSDLCDKFFRGYTKKQWGKDLSELLPSVAARIPTRTNDDDRYFSDTYQFMPDKGYSEMFSRMLEHPGIFLQLSTEFKALAKNINFDHLIFTGPIDSYFDYCFGALPYRSLRFEHCHHLHSDKVQVVGTINYPDRYDFTRITEFKHITGQLHAGTSIVKEYPVSKGDPYYPIPAKENEVLYKKYQELAASANNVSFVGRLAEYRYYNMDQVVGASIALSNKLLREHV